MYFPAICVDSFFNDPLAVRDLALRQEYFYCDNHPEGGTWPGMRTRPIYDFAPGFYKDFTNKFFSLFYNQNETFDFRMEASFQMIDDAQNGGITEGWIHQDENTMLAGIVYLNPYSRVESGTSLYMKESPDYLEASNELKREQYTRFDKKRYYEYKMSIGEHNSHFKEVVRFNNRFNRLVAYDGSNYHGVSSFKADFQEPRLTLVFFIKSMSANRFPLPAMRTVQI